MPPSSGRGGLQLRFRRLLLGNGDLQIAVAAADLIDQLLFAGGISQHDLVGQTEHTSHVKGFYTNKLIRIRIYLKYFIKNICIVQVFIFFTPVRS